MVADKIMESVKKYSDKTAVVERDKIYTYGAFGNSIYEMAKRLETLNLQKGEPVGIFLGNSFDFLVTLLASEWTGHPAILLSTTYKENEMQYHLFHAGIKYVVTEDRMGESHQKLYKKFSVAPRIGIWENTEKTETVKYCDGDFICQLTSGTDGESKGAIRTSDAVEKEMEETEFVLNFTEEDVVMTLPPLCHSYGLIAGALLPLAVGCTLVLLPEFRVAAAVQSMQKQKVTVVFAVPFMYKMIVSSKYMENKRLEGLRLCISAGAAMDPAVVEQFRNRSGVVIMQDYGSTETGVMALGAAKDISSSGLVGEVVGDRQIQIRDGSGKCVSTYEKGRIYTKSDCNLRCYLYPEDKNSHISDGWLDLGDLGFYDEEGGLHVCGRESSMINIGGLKVDPAEVEAVIREMPAVQEIVVVGVRNEVYGEVVKAVIVSDGSLSERDITNYCRGKIATHKIPKIIEFQNEITKSHTGKILRKYLV